MLKEHCIIHIGMHKTGTTSIQKTFARYLRNEHIHYVNLKTPNHSMPICSLFLKSEKRHWIHRRSGLSSEKIKQYNDETKKMLENEFLKNPAQTMLLSGEGIIRLSFKELMELKKFLQSFFRKITIVAYIRSPKSYMESIFQQRLKSGGLLEFILLPPNYKKQFNRFERAFGKENVLFWKFDPATFVKGNVVLDFCQKLNITIPEENVIKANESLTREAVQLLYIYRKYGPEYGVGSTVIKENLNLIRQLKTIGKEKFRVSPTLIQPILDKNVQDIMWIEERLGESFSENMTMSKTDIACEEDLLKINTETLQEFKKIFRGEFPSSGNFYVDLAEAIHCLRFQK